MPPQQILASDTVLIAEGADSDVGVTLAIAPTGSLTVDVTSLDPLVATVSPSTLTFTAADHDKPQMVTVHGALDGDVVANKTSISLTATDTPAVSVMVTVTDVRGGVWSTGQEIQTSAAHGIVAPPQVAMNLRDDAFSIWEQYDAANALQGFWGNRSALSGGWMVSQVVEPYRASCVFLTDQQIAVDSMGNAIAVWSRPDSDCISRSSVWTNRYAVGIGWGSPQLLETDDAGHANGPQIAVDSIGNALAVWVQSDGTRYNTVARRYTAGAGWGVTQPLETDNAGDTGGAAIAIDGNGNAIAMWSQSDGTRSNMWASRYVIGTGWVGPQLVETDNAGDTFGVTLAVDGVGNAVAVWSQRDATRVNIWANRFVAGNGWGTAQLIETNSAGDAFFPRVALDGAGNALAVWYQSDGTRDNIWANRYVAGNGWGTAQLIETNNTGRAIDPRVVVDQGGSALAVWSQTDGSHYSVWANRYLISAGWGGAQLLEMDSTDDNQNPALAIDASGNAVTVWRTRDKIWAARFQ